MSRVPTHQGAVAAAVVLLAGAAFAGGSLTAADAGASSTLSARQVKKIADKEIKKKAPGLSVAHAGTSDSATSAGTATTAAHAGTSDFATSAGSAATAAKVGSSSIQTFSAQVAPGGAPVVLATFGAMTLRGTCPGGVNTMTAAASPSGGALRFIFISGTGGIAHTGLPNLSSMTVNDISSAAGSGQLEYAPTTTGPAASMSYSWRTDGGACQFMGSSVSG